MRTSRIHFGSPLTRILALSFPLALFYTMVSLGQPGSLDTSFKPQTTPYSSTLGVALHADGRIVYLSSFPGYFAPSSAIGRLDTNGAVDTSFPTTFLTNGVAYTLADDGNNR